MFEVLNEEPVIHRVYDHTRANDLGYCWRKVFVVDDFYKNPDEVYNFLFDSLINNLCMILFILVTF